MKPQPKELTKQERSWLLENLPNEPALKVKVAMALLGDLIYTSKPSKDKPINIRGQDINALYLWTAAVVWSQKLKFGLDCINHIQNSEELKYGWFNKVYFSPTSLYEITFKFHLKDEMFIVGPFPQELKQQLQEAEKNSKEEELKKQKAQECEDKKREENKAREDVALSNVKKFDLESLKLKYNSILNAMKAQDYTPRLLNLIAVFKEKEINVNFQDSNGLTLLMHAINYHLDSFAEYLLEHEKANPFLKAANGLNAAIMISQSSPLHSLIWRAPRYSVTSDVDINSILLVIVKKIDVNLSEIKRLLILGADINHRDSDDFTPLMLAADTQNDRVVEYLLDNGANPLLKNKYGEIASNLVSVNTPLHLILKRKEKDFRLGSLTDKEKYSLILHDYVADIDVNISKIDEYLKLGADVNYQDMDGNTALILAANNQNEKIVEYLLNLGANPLIQNKYQKIAHHFFSPESNIFQILKGNELLFNAFEGKIEEVKLILNEKVEINFRGREGYTALLIAVENDFYDLVKFLLINGADQTITRNDGLGVYDLVKDSFILKLLEEKSLSLDSNSEAEESFDKAPEVKIADGHKFFQKR